MSSSVTSTPVKRACDSCHRRKVKCIGEGTNPCKNCVSAGLACTYNAIPQKKGPKGSRAKVLSELRENQRQSQLSSGYSPELGFEGRTLSTTFSRTPGLLPPGLIESCIEFFFINVYPAQPILHRQRIQEISINVEHSTEAYCMVVALCAYVMIQSNMTVSPNLLPRPEMAQMSNVSVGHMLLDESVRVRKGFDYLENPTHNSVLTSWLYYGCFFGLGRDNTAWSFLREATTLAQLLGMHDEETYKTDPLDISRRRVLYWLLLITERTHALHKHRPISLYATIHTPSLDESSSDSPIASGLDLLINLYKPFDDTFISLWNKSRTNANPSWITQLQTQLSEALPTFLECTEIQAVDLRISQQWLRTMVWQLCVSQGLVSSMTSDTAMTFKYPIEISRDLLSMMHQFSQQAMEVHGVGLIEKLFDIACCLTDVVACIPFSPDTFALGPRDYVSQFLTLFSTLRGGHTRYLPLLLSKVSDVLPNLPLPRSLNIPQALPPSTITLSPGGLATVPSNVNEDLPGMPPVSSPSYPSTELIRQLAAQTGAQLPINAQHSLLQAASSRVEDLSLYDSSAPHSATHSSGSAPASQSATPGPYEPSPSQTRAQIPPQAHSHSGVQVQSSHPHPHIQGQHLGVNPSQYDPRFAVQGFPVDPSMVYKQEDTQTASQMQGHASMYAQGSQSGAGRGGLGHVHGHHGGGRYAG
ncbi:uncharacterized protein BDR25DRAFT_45191 [Lindgomyces ingoldianus]|uniref:Uncharacterized protein n=1 Tax=Lindgomyces ingoldianus TaxID=673940 RepID=A0ACB6RDG5_9PLEO|nr:uncharacterized protein BDR25DRAFT_45191 [Lindgomyces ingoldianus]KAF2477284.1 hypothetical protein BDR25DRAFT_45191 [Lindgomyces ingoldianus]